MTEQINPPAITKRTMLPDATAAIIEQLRSAFPANEIDSRDAFAPWGATYLDGADYAKQLDGRSWNELDRSYLDRRSDALGFLSTKHLVAVLPAYLAQLVEGGPFSQVPDMLLLILTAPDSTKRDSWRRAIRKVDRGTFGIATRSGGGHARSVRARASRDRPRERCAGRTRPVLARLLEEGGLRCATR